MAVINFLPGSSRFPLSSLLWNNGPHVCIFYSTISTILRLASRGSWRDVAGERCFSFLVPVCCAFCFFCFCCMMSGAGVWGHPVASCSGSMPREVSWWPRSPGVGLVSTFPSEPFWSRHQVLYALCPDYLSPASSHSWRLFPACLATIEQLCPRQNFALPLWAAITPSPMRSEPQPFSRGSPSKLSFLDWSPSGLGNPCEFSLYLYI